MPLKRSIIILPFVPLIIYWNFLLGSAVNIPAWDDFDAVIRSLNDWKDAAVSEKFLFIIGQHNEHRILIIRLCVLLQHLLLGSVDFKQLVIVANLFLTFSFFLLWNWLSNKIENRVELTVIATSIGFLIFQPQYGDGMTWTTTALSSFPVITFALLTFQQLERGTYSSFVAAVICAVLALFTQGNGIVVLAAGLLGLLIKQDWRRAAIWLCIGTIFCGLFFVDYRKASYQHSYLDVILSPLTASDYFFTFLGSAWGASQHDISAMAGLTIFAIFAVSFIKSNKASNLSILLLFIFLLGSTALVTLSRSPSGIIYILSPGRYTIVSVFASVSAALIAILSIKNPVIRIRTSYLLLLISIVFNYLSYREYRFENLLFRDRLITELANWFVKQPPELTYPWRDSSERVMNESVKKGTYIPSDREFGKFTTIDSVIAPTSTFPNLKHKIYRTVLGPNHLLITGRANVFGQRDSDLKVFLIFKESGESVIFEPVKIGLETNFDNHFSELARNRSGFIALIPKDKLPQGQGVQMGIIYQYQKQTVVKWLKNQKLNLSN